MTVSRSQPSNGERADRWYYGIGFTLFAAGYAVALHMWGRSII